MVVAQLVERSFRSRHLHFESSHWQILFTIKCIEKRTGIAHFLKRHWELFHLLGSTHWLWRETHVREVVSLNRSTGY